MSDSASRRRRIAGERQRRTSVPEAPDEAPRTSAPDTAPPESGATSASAVSETQPAPASTGEAASAPEGAGRETPLAVPRWLLASLAVLLAAAVTFDVLLALKYRNDREQAGTQAAALTSAFNTAPAQAEKAAVRILGYDYKTLRADADEAKDYMTKEYAATFQNTVDNLLRAPAKQVRAHVEAKVMKSGVSSASPSKVEVLMFVDQVSTTTNNAEPQTSLNRVVFTMVKQGDRWLVSDITAL